MDRTLTQHPVGALLPALSEAKFVALKKSIDMIGQQVPGAVYDGQVLLGWHRYRACCDLGLDWSHTEVDLDPHRGETEQLAEIVFAEQDLRRDQMSSDARAMRAAKLMSMLEVEQAARKRAALEGDTATLEEIPEGRSVDRAASAMQVSSSRVRRARELASESPDLAQQVEAGTMRLAEAERVNRLQHGGDATPESAASIPSTFTEDVHGQPIPERLRDVFEQDAAFGEAVVVAVNSMRHHLSKWENSPAGAMAQGEVGNYLSKLSSAFNHYRPYAVCPKCKGAGCKFCANRGWINRSVWDQMEAVA